MRRLLIVEEALRNREGHWFEYNRATKAAVQSVSDVEVDMLGHESMDSAVAEELVARPHFRFTVWDQIYNHPQAVRRYIGIGLHNFRLYRDLSGYFKQSDYYDTVFAPTVVLHHLVAYHAIAKRFGRGAFGQLVLLIRNNIAMYDSEGRRTFRGTAGIWKTAIRRFMPMLKSGIVKFVTDSERLADEYEELTGIRFEVLPHPTLIGLSPVSGDSDKDTAHSSRIRVFLPGPARYEKGVARLLEAATLLRESVLNRSIEFVLQWREPFSLPHGEKIGPDDVSKFSSDRISFRVFREPLSSDDYYRELLAADAVVLPYRREAYYARISGVAVEAMTLGIPLLFTSDTWIDSVCQRFGLGLSMPDNSQGVAETLSGLSEVLGLLEEDARRKKGQVVDFFSARQFSRRLISAA